MSSSIGSIASVHRYPVKSMMGEQIASTSVTHDGVLGDRSYALRDTETGKIVSAKNPKRWPNLFGYSAAYTNALSDSAALPSVRVTSPDGATSVSSSADFARRLSLSLGRDVDLRAVPPQVPQIEEYWPDIDESRKRNVVTDETIRSGSFFDCAPLHLLTTSTLKHFSELNPGSRFEQRRFRPNFLVDTGEEQGFVENDWIGKTFAMGPEVLIEVTGPCPRCVMTILAQGDLPYDPRVLKAAAQNNHARVGVYASVKRAGTVRTGDTMSIV